MLRSLSRTGACAGLASAAVVLLAGPALAHVTIQSPGASQGGYAKVTFRVPAEKPLATTRLQVVFPADAPLGSVRVKPHPGWTYAVTTGKPAAPAKDANGDALASVVQSVTWTATAGGIEAGEFDEFDISAGPLPRVDQMTFKALQTYADGSVVRWIEVAAPGAAEPAHPAPVLKLAPAGASAADTMSHPTTVSSTGAITASATGSSASTGLSVAALAVAVLAGVLALVAVLRGRSTART